MNPQLTLGICFMKNTELESLGILRQTQVPAEFEWMTATEKLFMIHLLAAGENGVIKRAVLKEEKKSEHLSMRLSANGLANWERDRHGQERYFVISDRGEEVALTLRRIALNASRSGTRVAKPDYSVEG